MYKSVNAAFELKGWNRGLLDLALPVVVTKTAQVFLYNLGRINEKAQPQVLASASRVYDEKIRIKSYSFIARSTQKLLTV